MGFLGKSGPGKIHEVILVKGWLHIPAITSPSFLIHNNIFDVRKRNQKIIFHYLSQKKYSLLTLFLNGKVILTLQMITWENFFFYPILLSSNLMLRLSSIKCITIYSMPIKIYSKSVSEQAMFALFVRPNQKLSTISFTNALTQGNFGAILSVIGAFCQINRFVFHCRMLHVYWHHV